MKKLLLILLCLPMIGYGQQMTYVPDDNFEQALIYKGFDFVLDDYVNTASIDTVTYLLLEGCQISDLTGIEDFTALTKLSCEDNQFTSIDVSNNINLEELDCHFNQLTSLDVSNNPALTALNCRSNQLTSLDVRNGNNQNISQFLSWSNPNLNCINVDNPIWSTTNWDFNGHIDSQHYFSNNCSGTAIQEHTTNKELLRTTDLLGKETKNNPFFYIYDDGTVEKKFILE